ncbi:MAG: copper chaperone CopZ [Lactobacillales bacterium]|jgi:copper chaperone|nr:copper chaperone CopZ [Lactobacillales bacterium]
MKKQELTINGMTCNHCVMTVEKAAQNVAGVEKIKVNLKKGIGKVKFDEEIVNAETIAQAITQAGYQAEVK